MNDKKTNMARKNFIFTASGQEITAYQKQLFKNWKAKSFPHQKQEVMEY